MLRIIQYFAVFFLCTTSLVHADSHHPQDFLNRIAGTKDEGEQIVNQFCVNCHASKPLIPIGAPRLQNVSDWQPRMKQGLQRLFEHTAEGLNAMPPRGGCFECTDGQLILALLQMLPEKIKSDIKEELIDLKKNNK